MTKQEAKNRIEKLRKVINYHRYLYHVLDKQEISDAALDSLKHELKQLEDKYPEFITPDSPTQRVGGKPLDKFKKVEHKNIMLSLEDVFSEQELEKWEQRIKKLAQNERFDYYAEQKLDGFAISLIYKNGILQLASTRGDGRIGEDVTQNVKTIESVPLSLKKIGLVGKDLSNINFNLIKNGVIEIRGEILMTKDRFNEINRQRRQQGKKEYANPRNIAAGSIRQLDPRLAASRKLEFLAYAVTTDMGQATHQQEHKICNILGFKTDNGMYCQTLKDAIVYCNNVFKQREKLPYQIDGVVITVNNNKLFKKLGIVGKAPRGSIAFKFPAEQAITIVQDIIVQVGRTGILTPVAKLKPVKVGGTTITRATLHNMDEINRLGVRIGDTVIVERAGDVIPKIVKVFPKLRTGKEKKFQMPKYCPFCGSLVVKMPGEVYYRCSNKNCGAIRERELEHFVSKKGFDIIGLGPKIIKQLIDQGLIVDIADIFTLTQGDLKPLERFAEKSAQNLIKAIENSKKINLSKFIYALGIAHIGEENAIELARQISKRLKDKKLQISNIVRLLSKINKEDFEKIKDFGEIMAKSIYNWFHNEHNLEVLKRLEQNGVIIINQPEEFKLNSAIVNKNFVLTGTMNNLTREQAKVIIRKYGGNVNSNVSKKTDFVVVGKNPGSKYEKSKKLGINIINEQEFLKLFKNIL